MRLPYVLLRWLHRRRLSRHRMRGTLLHSWLGDRILARELWRPTRESVARGWLVGFPVTMLPFLPVQSVFACFAALFVRGNLLVCIALQFLSTPLTAPLQLPACYLVGAVLRGEPVAVTWERVTEHPGELLRPDALSTLYLGALVLGAVGALLGYVLIRCTWRERPLTAPGRARAATRPVAGG